MTPLAFVDESDAEPRGSRTGTYVLAAAVVEGSQKDFLDAAWRSYVRPGDDAHLRIHFSRIADRTRRKDLLVAAASQRGVTYVITWTSGYRSPKDREKVREGVLDAMLQNLAKERGVERIFIEQREEKTLREADSRVASRLKERDLFMRNAEIAQVRASEQPGLWLADAAALAWRRRLVESHDDLSRFFEPHTELIRVPWTGSNRR